VIGILKKHKKVKKSELRQIIKEELLNERGRAVGRFKNMATRSRITKHTTQ
jgi:hypothetical protein